MRSYCPLHGIYFDFCEKCAYGQSFLAGPKKGEPAFSKIESFYVIGSLRNPEIVQFANELQALGYEAFADWKSAGPDADDFLRDYSKDRGLNYKQALQTPAAKNIFQFDKFHLDRTDAAVFLMPGGRSAHLELGYTIGKGKPGFIVFDKEPERVDVMYQFATEIFFSKLEFFEYLKNQ